MTAAVRCGVCVWTWGGLGTRVRSRTAVLRRETARRGAAAHAARWLVGAAREGAPTPDLAARVHYFVEEDDVSYTIYLKKNQHSLARDTTQNTGALGRAQRGRRPDAGAGHARVTTCARVATAAPAAEPTSARGATATGDRESTDALPLRRGNTLSTPHIIQACHELTDHA